MSELVLGVRSLADLDGGAIDAAFQKELARCVAHIQNHPENAARRTITLRLSLVPEEVHNGCALRIATAFAIASAVPPRTSRAYSMAVTNGNRLKFQSDSPDDPTQRTIDELIEPKGETV